MSHHCLPAEQVLQDDLCQGGYVYWVGLINNQEFLAFLTKRKKSHFLYFWCLRDGQRVKSPSCTCLLPFWPLHDRWAVCSQARTGLDFKCQSADRLKGLGDVTLHSGRRATVSPAESWCSEMKQSNRSYGTAAELLKAWSTAHVGVILRSSWIKGLSCACTQINYSELLTRAPPSWDCGVDRTFPMGRRSLPVLPYLLPWGWLPTQRNTPNHLCEATYSKGPGTHWPAKHSVLDEPQVDHSNGPSSPKQQRLTNLIRTLGFRKSATQWTQGIEETLVSDW